MALKTSLFDVAEYLRNEEDIALFLEAVFEEGDPQLIAVALGDIARARSMTAIAEKTGLCRESLYKSLSGEGNPSFATITKVIDALGLKLEIKPKHVTEPEAA